MAVTCLPSMSLSSVKTASEGCVTSGSEKLTNFFNAFPKFSKIEKTLNVIMILLETRFSLDNHVPEKDMMGLGLLQDLQMAVSYIHGVT